MALKKILVLPDLHCPYHDQKAFNLFKKAAKAVRPQYLVTIGDLADFYSVSSHSKDPSRKALLVDEVAAVNRALDELDALRIKNKLFLGGNHEHRLERYVQQRAPELFGITNIKNLFHLKERGWKYVPYMEHTRIGKMHFTHDVGRSGKYAMQQTLDDFGHNVCFGHSHRLGVAYGGNTRGETHVSLNVGWMGDSSKIDYMHKGKVLKDWQLGFGLIYLDQRGVAYAQAVPIIKYTCLVEGRLLRT